MEKRVDPVMHVEYKAGDKMLVDYSGKHMFFVDRESGKVNEAEIFVAILGARQLFCVEVSLMQ